MSGVAPTTSRAPVLPRWVNLPGLGSIAAFAAVWELLVRTKVIDLEYLPAPSQLLTAVGPMLNEGTLAGDIVHTLSVALAGWAIASVAGVALGAVLGNVFRVWRWTAASVEFLRAVPAVTLVPLAVLLFGFSARMELVLIIYGALWMVLVGTMHAFFRAPATLLDTGRTLGLSAVKTVVSVLTPHGIPTILVSLRLALSLSLVLAVAAEILGNPTGLGAGIALAQQEYRPAAAFVYLVVIGLLGFLVNVGFRLASGLIFRRQLQAAERAA